MACRAVSTCDPPGFVLRPGRRPSYRKTSYTAPMRYPDDEVAVEVQWDHISRVIVTLRRDQTIFDTEKQEDERAYEVQPVNPDEGVAVRDRIRRICCS
jgi:hypothetical protein